MVGLHFSNFLSISSLFNRRSPFNRILFRTESLFTSSRHVRLPVLIFHFSRSHVLVSLPSSRCPQGFFTRVLHEERLATYGIAKKEEEVPGCEPSTSSNLVHEASTNPQDHDALTSFKKCYRTSVLQTDKSGRTQL